MKIIDDRRMAGRLRHGYSEKKLPMGSAVEGQKRRQNKGCTRKSFFQKRKQIVDPADTDKIFQTVFGSQKAICLLGGGPGRGVYS